ncbi:MAG: M28 family metallopeptidase [Pseudomonadota bacterium]
MRRFLILVIAASVAAPTFSLAKSAAETAETRIRSDMAFLADDALMGREPGTKGYDAAAKYAVKRMKSVGLTPADRKHWRQEVRLRSALRDVAAARLTLVDGDKQTELTHPDDYIIGQNFDPGSFDVSAPLVYAGYGVTAPEEGVDDYAGLDVAGRIVVIFGGAPPALHTEKRAFYSSGRVKNLNAAAHGAVGMISIQTTESANRAPWELFVSGVGRSSMATIGEDGRAEVTAPSIVAGASMSAAGAGKLFAGEKMDFAALQAEEAKGKGAPAGFEFRKTIRLAGASQLSDKKSANIIGVIEGSDPVLKNEVVLLTAHLDHIGLSPAAKPGEDAINNGALDNASGVAVMLEAARMFAESGARPKRSVAFVALTGEEKGLLGSDYLARHPAYAGKRAVSNVNLDMPVATYPFTDVIAFGAERSSLGPVVAAAAQSMGVALTADLQPEENIFIRSDHYSFVQQGIPSVFLVTGWANGGEKAFGEFLKNHYHKPSDDLSLPIDYDALARFADLNFRIARTLADAPTAPVWTSGDFFGSKFSK